LGEIRLSEMGLGEMGLGEMGQNRPVCSIFPYTVKVKDRNMFSQAPFVAD